MRDATRAKWNYKRWSLCSCGQKKGQRNVAIERARWYYFRGRNAIHRVTANTKVETTRHVGRAARNNSQPGILSPKPQQNLLWSGVN